jgi:DNA mismatch repair protein MutS
MKKVCRLIQILDKTISPMGSRLLKRWIVLPLKDIQQINERLDAVEFLIKERCFSKHYSSHQTNWRFRKIDF